MQQPDSENVEIYKERLVNQPDNENSESVIGYTVPDDDESSTTKETKKRGYDYKPLLGNVKSSSD